MAEAETISPWGPPSPPAPTPPAGPSRLQNFIWGALSTLLLAAWISWQMGWLWGVAAVFGVFVHEYGHVLVINWAGCGPSQIRIIPFFGGAATMQRPPDTEFKGVLIALAGPVFGMLATLPFFGLSAVTGDPSWQSGAFVIAAINLLNLAPAPPLDGAKALGPILARINPALERIALFAVGAFAVAWTFSRGSIILPVFISLSLLVSLRAARLRMPAAPLTWTEWWVGLVFYLGAVAICAAIAAIAAVGAGISLHIFSFGSIGGLK
jgi:Zn-dependent protease